MLSVIALLQPFFIVSLQRAREKELPELLSESRQYLSGLWSRLNGTAGRRQRALPPELKLPPSSTKEVDKVCVCVCGEGHGKG